MSEIVVEHTALADEEHEQLRLLVSKWQLLADLVFSDLVLWVPHRDASRLPVRSRQGDSAGSVRRRRRL
jgi:hypothetical protein